MDMDVDLKLKNALTFLEENNDFFIPLALYNSEKYRNEKENVEKYLKFIDIFNILNDFGEIENSYKLEHFNDKTFIDVYRIYNKYFYAIRKLNGLTGLYDYFEFYEVEKTGEDKYIRKF